MGFNLAFKGLMYDESIYTETEDTDHVACSNSELTLEILICFGVPWLLLINPSYRLQIPQRFKLSAKELYYDSTGIAPYCVP